MIKPIEQKDLGECVNVIRESFLTVANEFGFTPENASRFTAFATTEDRLVWHLLGERRPYLLILKMKRLLAIIRFCYKKTMNVN